MSNTSKSTALETLQTGGKVAPIVPTSWGEIVTIASAICRSGMAPKSYLDRQGNAIPDKVAVAMMAGMEVGLTPMASLQSIAVINGTPSLWGDGLMAVIRASGLLEDLQEGIELDDKTKMPLMAWCKVKRRGESWKERALTWPEVVRAGWSNKDGPWRMTPGRMMTIRVRTWLLRDVFADVLRGLRSAEEEQDMVDVTAQGSVTMAPEPQRQDYQESTGGFSPPTGDAGQTGEATRPVAGDDHPPTDVAGQPEPANPNITDVPDLSGRADLDDGEQPPPDAPPVFETYAKAGDFFAFADEYLDPGIERTEAEYIAFSTFYYDYMRERLNPAWRSRPVHDAMVDTKAQLDAAIQRAQKRGRS